MRTSYVSEWPLIGQTVEGGKNHRLWRISFVDVILSGFLQVTIATCKKVVHTSPICIKHSQIPFHLSTFINNNSHLMLAWYMRLQIRPKSLLSSSHMALNASRNLRTTPFVHVCVSSSKGNFCLPLNGQPTAQWYANSMRAHIDRILYY